MRKSWLIAVVPGAVAGLVTVVVGLFVLALLLVKVVWSWTIPDIFPGAVEQGLVARSISWFTALKIAILVAVLGGVSGISGHGKSQ
jgi:hypothetical protein